MNLKKMVSSFFLEKPGKIIGIDIGDTSVKMVQIDLKKEYQEVSNFAIKELPPTLSNAGYLNHVNEMIDFIKDTFAENNFTAKHIVFSVGGRNTFVREITIPVMSDSEMINSAIWEAGQYVPYEANRFYADAAKFGKADEKGMQSMLLVAAPKELVDALVDIAAGLGLKLLKIEIDVLALYRIMKKPYKDFLLVDLGRDYSLVTIFQEGAPVAQRSIPFGGQKFTKAVEDGANCSFIEAEEKKKDINVLVDASDVMQEKYKEFIDVATQFTREVVRTGEYYKMNKKGATFDKIVLTGGGSGITGLAEFMSELCQPSTVESLEISESIDYVLNISKSKIAELDLLCPVAIGAAVAGGDTDVED